MPSKGNKVSSKSQVHLSLLLRFQRVLWNHTIGSFAFSEVKVVCCYICGYLSGFAVYRDLFHVAWL